MITDSRGYLGVRLKGNERRPNNTFLFFAYPNALWVTWRMRETIGAA